MFLQTRIFFKEYSFNNFTLYTFLQKPSACSLILIRGYPTALNLGEKIALGNIIYLFEGDSKRSNLIILLHDEYYLSYKKNDKVFRQLIMTQSIHKLMFFIT